MKGISKGWIFFLVIIVLFIWVTASYPSGYYEISSNLQQNKITDPLYSILRTIGLPDGWLYTPGIFYMFLIPFVGIFAIVFGLLREIAIFRNVRNIDWILALVISFSIIPLGFFVRLVSGMFATIGVSSTIAFGILFFAGLGYVIIQRLSGWGWIGGGGTYRGLKLENRYNQLRNWLLTQDHAHAGQRTVAGIPAALNDADNAWNAGKCDEAVRKLESKAASVSNRLPGRPRPP